MIYRASRYDHVSSLLKELHWLRVPERIELKLCALVYKCLNGSDWPTSLTVIFVVIADRPGDTSCNTGRPCVSGRRRPGLERPTRLRHVSANLLIIPYSVEDVYVFPDFLPLTTCVTLTL